MLCIQSFSTKNDFNRLDPPSKGGSFHCGSFHCVLNQPASQLYVQSDVKPELSKLHLQVTKTVMSSSSCSIKASIPAHFRFQLFTVPVFPYEELCPCVGL